MGTYEILNHANKLQDIVIAVDKNHACSIFAKRVNGKAVYKKIEDDEKYTINFVEDYAISMYINKISEELVLSKLCIKRLKENKLPIF